MNGPGRDQDNIVNLEFQFQGPAQDGAGSFFHKSQGKLFMGVFFNGIGGFSTGFDLHEGQMPVSDDPCFVHWILSRVLQLDSIVWVKLLQFP